jgi:hypothetical protein
MTDAAEVWLNLQKSLLPIYDRLNALHFAEKLPSTVLIMEDTWHLLEPGVGGRVVELTDYWGIILTENLLAHGQDAGWLMCVLLHEMIHVEVMADPPEDYDEDEPHGRAFTEECNRIGADLGWPTFYAPGDDRCLDEELRTTSWPFLGDRLPDMTILERLI